MKRIRQGQRPQPISEDDFMEIILWAVKKTERLSLKLNQPQEFFISSTVAPLSFCLAYRRRMLELNKNNTSIPIHISNVSCDEITPETQVLCITHYNGQLYVHRHPAGECWFLVYPRNKEILLKEGENLS